MSPLSRCRSLVLALFVATACGGKANSSTGAPTGGAAQGGTGGSGGGAMTEPESPSFDDVFPWFDGSGASEFPTSQTDEVLHIAATGTPARATLSTHNHVDLLSYAEAIVFSARASAPTRLLVSASNAIQAYDYFDARDQGIQWPIVPVEVGLEWQDYRVPLSDMMPVETGDADGIASFWLAFVVEHSEPVDVWLDDVRFEQKK